MSDLAPAKVKVQAESVFTGKPVAQSLMATVGQGMNFAVINTAQVGDVVSSFLDEATFQSLRDTTWILCDGRSVAGSEFQSLTGLALAPDMRGRYPRMKDNGAGVDPAGDLALGTTYADQIANHAHNGNTGGGSGVTNNVVLFGGGPSSGLLLGAGNFHSATSSWTNIAIPNGPETRVKSGIMNFFLKINTN